MKVSDLYTTITQIIHHHHNVIPTLTLPVCDSFQNYVQKCKAEHHFRTGAGSSVVSSLKAEIKALTVQVSSPERNTVNSINECTTRTCTCTSLQFLKRHAKCLALLVGWVETTYAVMGRNDSNPYEANINAVSFQQELASLVNVIVDLVSADLKVMFALMAGAKSSGGIVFHRYFD